MTYHCLEYQECIWFCRPTFVKTRVSACLDGTMRSIIDAQHVRATRAAQTKFSSTKCQAYLLPLASATISIQVHRQRRAWSSLAVVLPKSPACANHRRSRRRWPGTLGGSLGLYTAHEPSIVSCRSSRQTWYNCGHRLQSRCQPNALNAICGL